MNNTETTDNPNVGYIQKLHRWRMAFFGVIILFAGIVIGGASMMILVPHRLMRPPAGPEFRSMRMIPRLRRDLGLSDEQAKKIRPMLQEHFKKLNAIREDARSEVGKTLEQMNEDISSVLTEEQAKIWERRLGRLEQELRPGGLRRGAGEGAPRRRRGQLAPPRQGPGPLGLRPPAESNLSRHGMDHGAASEDEQPAVQD